MQLKRARVTKYRSIEDSGWVEFRDVVALVGKNESGKTTFLHALEKLNPAEGTHGDFNPVMDYPRREYAKYKKTHESAPATVVEAEFEISDAEVAQIEKALGAGVLRSRQVTASKNYKNARTWTVEVDEGAAIRHLAAGAGLPAEVDELVRTSANIVALIKALEALADKAPSTTTFLTTLKAKFTEEKGLVWVVINSYLVKLAPRFVYFDDYSVMRGTINLQTFAEKKNANPSTLDDADRTFLALLGLADSTLDDFVANQNYESLKAQLEAASTSITDDVFKYWTQNKQLQVEFDVAAGTKAEPAPFNSGTNLHVRIKNERHRVTVPFDERSRGFVWFFSFFAYFSQLDGKPGSVVLLLDEPGLSLHAKAQEDFLRFIDERLAPDYQVVYTTHSNFMIAPDKLDRVWTVQDVDGQGTVISNDVLKNDKDTIFPLQAALGYNMAQTLFVGVNNLLVEGPSDLLYLTLLGRVVSVAGKRPLDPSWIVVPAGGADKVSTFVSLLGANGFNIAVLMDVAAKDRQRIEGLQAHALLGRSALVQVTEVTGTKAADIEDIFMPGFYLKLVNGAYRDALAKPLTLDMLPVGGPRIVKRIEAYFDQNGIDGGRFNHYLPAEYFMKEQVSLLGEVDTATVERAERLFNRVNSLLPDQSEAQAAHRPIRTNLRQETQVQAAASPA